MIHHLFALILFFASLSSACFCAQDAATEPFVQKKLSLLDCQEIALKNSKELTIADIETLMAQDVVKEIKGNNLPQLTATGNYTSRNNHRGAVFWARPEPSHKQQEEHHEAEEHHKHKKEHRPRKEKMKTIGGNKQVRTARLALIVPIYDFSVTKNKARSQQMLVDASIQDRKRIEQDLLYAVTQCYYKLLESQKIEAVVHKSIEVLKKQLSCTKDFHAVGLATKNEFSEVEMQIAKREHDLVRAKNNVKRAALELKQLLGEGKELSLEIEDLLEEHNWNKNVEGLIAKAILHHPALKSLTAQKEASVFDYESEKGRLLPTVVAFSSANACSDSYLLHKHWVDFGVGIELPILDGGITNVRIDRKRKAIQEFDLKYQVKLDEIEYEIKNAFHEVESAYQHIPVAKRGILHAQESLKLTQDLFEEGLVTTADLLDDEEMLDVAKSNYYQSLYAFHMAQSELEYAAGTINKSQE